MSKKGWLALVSGQAYHTDTDEKNPVYHNSPRCPDGLLIKRKNLQPGDDGHELCDICDCLQLKAARARKQAPTPAR